MSTKLVLNAMKALIPELEKLGPYTVGFEQMLKKYDDRVELRLRCFKNIAQLEVVIDQRMFRVYEWKPGDKYIWHDRRADLDPLFAAQNLWKVMLQELGESA